MAPIEKYQVGRTYTNKFGLEFEVVEKIRTARYKIKFKNGVMRELSYNTLENCDFKTENRIDYSIGNIFNIQGEDFIVVEKKSNKLTLQSMLNEKNTIKTSSSSILYSNIKNNFSPSVFGIGYLGTYDKVIKKIHTKWSSMLRRCYSEWFKDNRKNIEGYKNTVVCKEWHSYKNFEEWYLRTFPQETKEIIFNLDKDLLQQYIENKVYSPSTCCWLPAKVNTFLCNSQSTNKTKRIGVSKESSCNKYKAQIKDFETNKKMHLGLYLTIEEASNAYIKERKNQIESVKKYLISFGIDDIKIHNAISDAYPKYNTELI